MGLSAFNRARERQAKKQQEEQAKRADKQAEAKVVKEPKPTKKR